jgi:hypothetical protein
MKFKNKINHENDKKKIAMKLMGTTFDIWKKKTKKMIKLN